MDNDSSRAWSQSSSLAERSEVAFDRERAEAVAHVAVRYRTLRAANGKTVRFDVKASVRPAATGHHRLLIETGRPKALESTEVEEADPPASVTGQPLDSIDPIHPAG